MIITEAMARDAWNTLNGIGTFDATEFEALLPEQVTSRYRYAARFVHPDLGGSSEAFAKVDRAKHVLIGWLNRKDGPSARHEQEDCNHCGGKGRVTVQRAFRQMTVMCLKCRGSGDANYDHDNKEGDTR